MTSKLWMSAVASGAMVVAVGAAMWTPGVVSAQEGAPAAATTQPAGGGEKRTTQSGLQIIETQKLEKPTVSQVGDVVLVHYTGTLENGTKFDSSLDAGRPFPLKLGEKSVIAGWEEGLIGMQVGEKRRLIIPPNLGYGAEGRPPQIPPNSTLIFDVEIVGLNRGI